MRVDKVVDYIIRLLSGGGRRGEKREKKGCSEVSFSRNILQKKNYFKL